MIMLRILLLLAIAGLAIWWWRRLTRPPVSARPPDAFESTVQCASCGTHIAQRLATQVGDRYFCPDHAPGTRE